MSLNYNKIFIGGRLCETPVLKTTASGRETATVGVAVNRPAKQGEQPEADFFNIVAWNKQAQFLTRYFQKGDPVFVSGRLSVRPWKDRDGNNRTAVEIIAGEINFVESRKRDEQQTGAPANTYKPGYIPDAYTSTAAPALENIDTDEELPF